MDIIYLENYAYKVEQDKGHEGVLHDYTSGEKHLGMFVFQFVEPQEFIHFKLCLRVEQFEHNFTQRKQIGTIIPGTFMYPTYIWGNDFLTINDLGYCGWEQIELNLDDEIHHIVNRKPVEHKVYSDDIVNGKLEIEYHFNFNGQYLGFLFVPEKTSDYDYPVDHFKLKFYDFNAQQSKKPVLKCQPALLYKTSTDVSGGLDNTEHMEPDVIHNRDIGFEHEVANAQAHFEENDRAMGAECYNGVRIRSIDPAHNFSLSIQNIALKEKGEIVEIYGFNGYTARTYYEKKIRGRDFVYLKKLNFMTWSGILVEWPWCAMLWYGEIVYFANSEEFAQCCREYFAEHGMDECPICGNPLGHFKISYIDITRVPHQLYFCSMDCLHAFDQRLMYYLKSLTKDNIQYLIKDLM